MFSADFGVPFHTFKLLNIDLVFQGKPNYEQITSISFTTTFIQLVSMHFGCCRPCYYGWFGCLLEF